MSVVLVVTNSADEKVRLINCENTEDALKRMESMFRVMCFDGCCDYNNTYLDKKSQYAQVVDGFSQTEMRIGVL